MKKIDTLAWVAEGFAPAFIAAFLFFITGAKDPFFYLFFAGSLALGQLLSLIIKVSTSFDNIKLISRPDNVIRIATVCLVLCFKLYLFQYYIFVWLILNIFIFWIIGKCTSFGRFAYNLSSYYSRLINFMYLIWTFVLTTL
jgi:hypothetical protein